MPGERTRGSGELEAAVMKVLWAADGPLTAKEILGRMSGRTPAHTTMLTALDRLVHKGLVARNGSALRGVGFLACQSEADHASAQMIDALSDSGDRHAALLAFAGDLDAEDVDLLNRAIAARGRKKS